MKEKNINDLSLENEIDLSFFNTILTTEDGDITYKWVNQDNGKIVDKELLYRRIPDLNWTIISAILLDDYTRIRTHINWFIFTIFILALLLFWVSSTRISRLLSLPLDNLIEFVDQAAQTRYSNRIPVKGTDEYSRLSLHINRFLDTIEEEKNNRLIAEEDNRTLAQVISNIPYPVARVNTQGTILYKNCAAIDLLFFWETGETNLLPQDLLNLIISIKSDFGEVEFSNKGQFYNILVSYSNSQDAFFIFISNITNRKKDEYLLIMSESVFSHTMEGISITDQKGEIVRVNPAFTSITGYTEEEAIGKNPRILKSEHHPAEFYEELWDHLETKGEWKGEIWNRRKNGEVYPELLTINSIKNSIGATTHYVGVFKDISDIKSSEEKLRHQAFHDALTNLPNRSLFLDRLNHAIIHAHRISGKLAILFLDMDNFKNINDTMGHLTGDRYLQVIARRLSSICRDEDTVARLGGDEFVILIPEIEGQHGIAQITNRILRVLGDSLILNKHEFNPTVSIGVALYPEDGKDAQTLMKNADLAMYKSKENGKGISTLFNDEMNRQLKKRIQIEGLLRSSVKKNEMTLVYQPKISSSDLRISGAEALVRWNSKELGMVPPSEFIPIAEETGFILELGDWVLEQALSDTADFKKRFPPHFEIAVNLSARQFQDKELVNRLKKIIEKSSIAPEAINLEITENMAMGDSEKAIEITEKLKELNLTLSIDDFGTGYSSYNYLKQYGAKYLKIDKSFVDEIPDDRKSGLIMKNIIDLGHILGMEVIAEGVESEEQYSFLKDSGCDIIQGYYFSKPLSKYELLEFEISL